MPRRKLVILGAGFAGLQLARNLRHADCDITVIDRYNFHQFQPLFYQVATARLEPSAVSFPLRKVFQGRKNVRVRVAQVKSVDVAQKRVHTDDAGDFEYDYLVVATGCTTNFFGNKQLEEHSFPMKSTTEAIALRNRILLNFEDALEATGEELEAIMNIAIVGGGPTGVELAGALAEMKKNVLPKDYPDMDFSRLRIHLIEGGPATLGPMSEKSQQESLKYLQDMGVEVVLNTVVKDYDGRIATFSDGKHLPTRTLIWAAGVTGNVPVGIPKEAVVRGNRIKVDQFNGVPGLDGVYVIGDLAYMETPEWPKGHPQLGNVAVNQGKHLAKNIKRLLTGGGQQPFTYKNPGTMATVGKRRAVVDLPKFHFSGWLAWLTWMFLHLMLILSVRNRFFIFLNWAISYITNDTTLRLILLPTEKQVDLAEEHGAVSMPKPSKPVAFA